MGGDAPPRTPGKERLPTLAEYWQEAKRKALAEAQARQARNETAIPAEAKKHVGSSAWAHSANKPPYSPGTNKCNLFVYEVLNGAGTPVPMKIRFSWRSFGNVKYPPLAGQWADPDVTIPGWEVVQSPRPGDVVAMKEDYSDASGHVGIVSGPGTSVSVSSSTGSVVENDWGFRSDQKDVVFRRYVGAPEPKTPVWTDQKWPTRGRNAP
jgi:cell wall-associated NlpC family hydrolase